MLVSLWHTYLSYHYLSFFRSKRSNMNVHSRHIKNILPTCKELFINFSNLRHILKLYGIYCAIPLSNWTWVRSIPFHHVTDFLFLGYLPTLFQVHELSSVDWDVKAVMSGDWKASAVVCLKAHPGIGLRDWDKPRNNSGYSSCIFHGFYIIEIFKLFPNKLLN
jgi:hypothetical protein